MQDTSSDKYLNDNGNGNGNKNGHYLQSLALVERESNSEEEDGLDLRQFLHVIKHRIRLILLITLGFTALASFWTFKQEPRYKGTFHLLIEPAATEKQQNPLKLLNTEFSDVDYDTQIEVLRSSSVLQPIIKKIAAKYPGLRYEDLILEGKSPLEIQQLKETKILEISYTDKDPKKIKFILDNLSKSYLDYSLQERKTDINQGIQFVGDRLPELQTRVNFLQAKLQTFRQKYNLIDPEQQANRLSEQLVKVEEQYFDTQVKYKETNSLFLLLQNQLGLQPNQALAGSYLSESPRYQNLLNELQKIEVEIANKSVIFLDDSPVMQDLKDKREQLLPLLDREAQGVLGANLSIATESPAVASPSTLRLDLNQQYIKSANEIQVLDLRRQALELAVKKLNKQIENMPVIARQYTDLQRQLNLATESLTKFLASKQDLELQSAQKALPWKIISPAKLPNKPVSPNPTRNISLGVMMGLLMGIGAALLAERLDPVFHSIEELKELIQLPLLGTIPFQKDLKPMEHNLPQEEESSLPQLQIGNIQLKVKNTPKGESRKRNWYNASPFLEAFRSLNTNIQLLGSDSPINSFVISSSIPSEGKSTISSHLAQAAAAMGQRVLLIDADLRRPQVHHWVGLNNDRGLSNVLATGIEVESVIQKVPYWDNLSIMTAGDIPPDPTRLLSSKKMQNLMEYLKNKGSFDLIIYDTPPIFGFADGRILATRTNGVVLVVKLGKTDRSLLKQNIDNLKTSNVSLLGLVANNVSRNSPGSYYYYNKYYARR
jgi:capsular exopolysaccharide synthesis family protein